MIVEYAGKIMLWESLKACTPVLHLQRHCVWITDVCNWLWNGMIQSGHRKKQPPSTRVFTFFKRAERPRRPASQKPNQGVSVFKLVHLKIKTLQHWTNEPCSSLNSKMCYWVPGEKCSFPARISWSSSSKAANTKKGKTFLPLKLQPEH